MKLTVKQLSSGRYHIRGEGPCNWTQPQHWPTTPEKIRAAAFPEASEEFIQEVIKLAEFEANERN